MNSSVGKMLQEAREHQGRSIAEVADQLCLTQRYLRAIENDDIADLPGPFFYKSFVIQYAQFLGLPSEQVQAGLDTLLGSQEPVSSAPVDPAVESTNRHYLTDRAVGWRIAALVAVVLGCTGFYAWWNRAAQPARSASSHAPLTVSPVTVSVTPAGTATEVNQAVNQVAALRVSQTDNSNDASTVVLSLSATKETWLSITSGGKQIFSGTLRPNETTQVKGADMATMHVGNAGGIDVQLNGKPIPRLGSEGEVLWVQFTPREAKVVPNPQDRL
jgi:cytoskeletal protein RodZ